MLVPMSKEQFVARMLDDAEKRKRSEADRKRKAAIDMAEYTAMRRMQAQRYLWRKAKR